MANGQLGGAGHTQMFVELIELLPIFLMQHHNAPSVPENGFADCGWDVLG